LQTEQVFVIEITEKLTDRKVYFWGFKDVEVCVSGVVGEVYDLKTTKSFNWRKNEQELRENIQANVYALDTLLMSMCVQVFLQWVYVRTQGAPAAGKTPVWFQEQATLDFCASLAEKAFVMVALKHKAKEAR